MHNTLNNMTIVTALLLQSWFDIALQYTGSIENAFVVAKANDSSVTELITAGESFIIPSDARIYNREVNYLSGKKVIPATGINETTTDLPIRPGGIGQMAIGIDFIVS